MTFRLSPSYGIHDAREAHDWFLGMMRVHEEFVVETDEPGEPPLSFWSETVRGGDGGVATRKVPMLRKIRHLIGDKGGGQQCRISSQIIKTQRLNEL